MRTIAVLAAGLLASYGCRADRAPAPGAPPAGSAVDPAATTAAAAAAATTPPARSGAGVAAEHAEHGPAASVVECPVTVAPSTSDDDQVAALLEGANQAISGGAFGAAWTCADRAADLAPSSVEAHHLRGAALAGLGRDAEAQVAYSLALALDPDDPETLRAVADFYINGRGDRGRDGLRLGLELAQRGSRRVLARRRPAPSLAAELALLEGQALNDLGRSDEALVRVDVALKHAPGRADALHERGVALFDLSRFAEARTALERSIAIQPDDAYSHQLLGLVLEQLGDAEGAEREQARAVALAPGELAPPVLISPAEMRGEVDAVVKTLSPEQSARLGTTRLEIADLPDPSDLAAVKPPFPPTILGLFRGPVGRGAHASPGEPTSIVLYRKNLARAVKTRAELTEQIRQTLVHELGHLEGLDEDDLRRRGMD